jgi:hypothetical protein
MTDAASLGVDGYRTLLTAALASAQDSNTVPPSLSNLFTPDSHRLALDVDATVVRGGRGVGKTFWYQSLLKQDLRRVAATEYRMDRLNFLKVAAGFGTDLEPERYPGPGELRQLVNAGTNPYELWTAVLLAALEQPDLLRIEPWTDRVAWVRDHPDERDRTIARADRQAQADGLTRLILFDALEHLHSDRRLADRLVAGILQLSLELRLGTRNIRSKIFIRPDMFDGALLHFPDASKLISNAASLTWSTTNLYGLFFHYLGNDSGDESAAFRALSSGWTEPTAGRHLPSASLLGDAEVQAEAFKAMAGPYMGANYRKGITYTWLPNHLMDGAEQVSPRSFLNALTMAVQETVAKYAAHGFAIHHEGIRRGVQSASRIRVWEIREDLPWVHLAIEQLDGQQVPIDESTILDLWDTCNLTGQLRRQADSISSSPHEEKVRTGPRFPDDYPHLIEELIELGVMRRRKDGRIDLPDVYRIAFSVGRKGGVPKVKA